MAAQQGAATRPPPVLPVTRQATSPFDAVGLLPVTRQPTSPFDVLVAEDDKIRALGEHKAEFSLPTLRLIYSAGEQTSFFVQQSSHELAPVGYRIVLSKWAPDGGMLLTLNNKNFHASGSLSSEPVDLRAQKQAEQFGRFLADLSGMSLDTFLVALAKRANGSPTAIERAEKIAAALTRTDAPPQLASSGSSSS